MPVRGGRFRHLVENTPNNRSLRFRPFPIPCPLVLRLLFDERLLRRAERHADGGVHAGRLGFAGNVWRGVWLHLGI